VSDGVIKYRIEHTAFDARIPYDLYGELEAVRSRLHHLGLIGVDAAGIGYGNISLKEAAHQKGFYVTSTQTGHLSQLGTSYYTQVNDYDFSTFTLYSTGEHQPSSEALSHAMIYALDPNIRAVIHIHSRPLWEFMIKRGDLATTAAYGTRAMTQEIAGLYEKTSPLAQPMFVMKGHEEGIIAFAQNLKHAETTLLHLLKAFMNVS